jgi:DNA-binding NarL/FixJ family response regulator
VSELVPWRAPRLAGLPRTVVITCRQADVLAGICHGHTNAEIGRRLGVSEDTVKSHARLLFRALGARDRAHAAALACTGQVNVVVRDTTIKTGRKAA